MKSLSYRFRATVAFVLIATFGAFSFLPEANARLIFTTEGDGVVSDAYHIDQDDSSATFIDLAFGSELTNRLRYDISAGKFIFSKALSLAGNQLMDFIVERFTTAGAPTCEAGLAGRMYYDTTTDKLLFCNGTAWTDSATIDDDSITGAHLAAAIAGEGLVQDGSGNLDVNTDDTTLEISGDAVQIKDLGVSTGKLAADAVTAAKLADDAVDTAAIVDLNVTTAKIAADAIDNTKLADNAVQTENITDLHVTTGKLAADAVTAAKLADDAVDTAAIVDLNVTTAKIADLNVTTGKIAADAIDNTKLADNAVQTENITDLHVTTGKLAADAVTAAKLADDAVDTAAIVDLNVTTAKIAADAVDNTKLADNAVQTENILLDTILAEDIAANAIGSSELADDAVDTAAIVDLNVTTEKLEADAITNAKLADDAVDTENIADGAVEFAQLAEREVTFTLNPEFQNFTLVADGSENIGTMEADYDATGKRNYYKWSTKKTSDQDYDIYLQWAIPENFQGFSLTDNEIEVDYKTTTITSTDNTLGITLADTAGTDVTLTGGTGLVSSSEDTWVDDGAITFTGGTFTAGEYITLKIKMTSDTENAAYLGPIKFNVRVK